MKNETKLKTLKDIERCSIIPCTTNMHRRGVLSKELRQEAIKWVKEDIKIFGYELSIKKNYRWMNFFNITEEDLK